MSDKAFSLAILAITVAADVGIVLIYRKYQKKASDKK